MTDPRLADLQSSLPDLRLKTDPADLEHYGRDWTRRWTPAPLAIALPATVAEVQAVVRWANAQGVAVVPSGGRTGLSGGAVAANGELVLSLERMNRVLGFDPVDRTLAVQAGMVLEAVHNAAREHGLVYPVDFGARGSCSIGGNIATNAGGIRVIRYGNTREWIAGLTVVTGAGEVLELNRALVKNSSGYDFRQLMVGSEGTLGIVVEAILRLADPPPPTNVMLLALPSFEVLRSLPVYRELLHQWCAYDLIGFQTKRDLDAFVEESARVLTASGQLFVYTRTPEQNAASIWGREFPGFTSRETRLRDAATFERALRPLGEVRCRTFTFPRRATREVLAQRVRARGYSTFSLYENDELEAALSEFLEKLASDVVRWQDRNLLVHVQRSCQGSRARLRPRTLT